MGYLPNDICGFTNMSNPNNFILNTDYATHKNDDNGQVTLYIGQSPVMNYGDNYTYESSLTIGAADSGIRCQMQSSAITGIWSTPQMQITLQATTSTVPATVADYPATVYIERTSPTTLKLKCNVYGMAVGLTQQITGKFQTITADVATFLSPFI